jgi:two-component sensor histidine kinase
MKMRAMGSHWRLVVAGFIGWTLFSVFFALQSYANSVYFGQSQALWTVLKVWLICGYTWMFLTPALIFLSQRFFIKRGQISRNLLIHFLAGSLISLVQLSIFILARQVFLGDAQKAFSFFGDFQRIFIGQFHVNLLIYWIVIGIWHLRIINQRYLERVQETARLALDTSQLETKLAQSRLHTLKMQLHPHFLFNTLNSISVLMRDDAEAADRMLVRLSELFRIMLKKDSPQEVSLKEELEFLRGYLEIEQTRFQDRLTVDFEIAPDTLAAQVPNMILQPLVENAIRHGIAPRIEAGKLLIETKRKNGFVELEVSDNGGGLSGPVDESKGIGLRNTRERLSKLYGENHKFEIISSSEHPSGLRVTIQIPFHTNEAHGGK